MSGGWNKLKIEHVAKRGNRGWSLRTLEVEFIDSPHFGEVGSDEVNRCRLGRVAGVLHHEGAS